MDNINTLPRIGKQNSKNAQILKDFKDLKCWKITKYCYQLKQQPQES